jgi:hypothetical protein
MKINNSSIFPVLAGTCFLLSYNSQAIGPSVSADESATPPAKSKEEKTKTEPITVSFSLAQNVSGLGRVVAFSLTARNTGNEEQALLFNSGQNFEITATPINAKAKQPLWHWSNDKRFTQALRRENIRPGESKTWTAIWQGEDNNGNPAPRGLYLLEATITANGGLKPAPITLDVRAEGIRQATPRKNDLDAGLVAKMESDKTTYASDESANFTLTLKNESGQTTALTYPSGQQYDFAARPAPKGKFDPKQKVIWHWSRGRAFTMMLQMKQFAPGETLTFKDKWELKDQNGRLVPPGQYAIEAFVSANRGIGAPPVIIEVK